MNNRSVRRVDGGSFDSIPMQARMKDTYKGSKGNQSQPIVEPPDWMFEIIFYLSINFPVPTVSLKLGRCKKERWKTEIEIGRQVSE